MRKSCLDSDGDSPESEAAGLREATLDSPATGSCSHRVPEVPRVPSDCKNTRGLNKPERCKPGGAPPAEHNIGAVMHAMGDSPEPLEESVVLMESLLEEFVRELMQDAMDLSVSKSLGLDHILGAIRKDKLKFKFAMKRIEQYRKVIEDRKAAMRQMGGEQP
mmetsp:Transcript_9814/g.24151  ORF Transcript_9814/g.24151 Transcript_9814/m.24151 type:complete len:162 (-) Transcript_9814:441-926(-)